MDSNLLQPKCIVQLNGQNVRVYGQIGQVFVDFSFILHYGEVYSSRRRLGNVLLDITDFVGIVENRLENKR